MPRPRSLEPDAVVEAAMRLFWRKGYDAVSFDDLVADTGASRRAIYSLWSGKQALLVASLALYRRQVGDALLRGMEGEGAGRAAIETFWDRFETAARNRSWRGCLIMRTASTAVAAERDVAREIAAYVDRFLDALRHGLESAVARDEIAGSIDPGAASRLGFSVAVACSVAGSARGYDRRVAALIAAGRRACGVAEPGS